MSISTLRNGRYILIEPCSLGLPLDVERRLYIEKAELYRKIPATKAIIVEAALRAYFALSPEERLKLLDRAIRGLDLEAIAIDRNSAR